MFERVAPVIPVTDHSAALEPYRRLGFTVRAAWLAAGVEGRFSAVKQTEYGMDEFAFVDPDGTLHRVGSRLAS
jgi:hypothetical protein